MKEQLGADDYSTRKRLSLPVARRGMLSTTVTVTDGNRVGEAGTVLDGCCSMVDASAVRSRGRGGQPLRGRPRHVWPALALVLAVLAFPAAASAAVFQVTNTSDPGTGTCSPGNCSLRDAIAAANGGSGSDTVLIPPGVYVLGAGGALSVTTGVQIVGTAGASSTIIDAHNASGILSITASAGLVSVSGLTLTHGKGSSGSAIADLGAQLTLSEDVFTLNTTGGEGAGGSGAVGVSGKGSKTLAVANSTFAENAAGGEGTKNTSSGQGSGGGIAFQATGTLTVTNSTFTGNTAGGNGGEGTSSAQGGGGAIDAFGDAVVSVTNSSFTANRAGGNGGAGVSSAQGVGGAIEFFGNAAADTLTVTGSTFSGNQAGGSAGTGTSSGEGVGGAISAFGEGSVTLTNDTLQGNSVGGPIGGTSPGAGAVGGGLNTGLAATLLNDTLDGNAVIGKSGAGGNINASPGAVTLKNSIVAGGSATNGANCAGTVTSAGHNIESTTPSQCGLNPALSDLIGVNPLLGPLQFNGGATQTQALLSGSPAINAGDNNGCPATDERGVRRPFGPACDIGAYEVAPPAASTGSAGAISTTGATITGTVTANAVDASVYFQIGTTTAYGLQTAVQHVGGVLATPVSANLAGLSPNTTFHYRVVASSTEGTTVGSDRTFTTSTQPPGARIANLTALSEAYSIFAVGGPSTPLSGRTAAKRHHKGTVFSFRLDQPATIKVAIQTTARGRRVGRACKPESHKLRHKPRCTRTVTIATLIRSAHAGLNKIGFTGRIRGKALKPGRYKAVFTAVDAAGASARQSLSFTIVKG